MTTADEPYDLSVTEAADILGVHIDTLRQWTDDGLIPCWRTPGGHRRYRRSDLIAFRDNDNEQAS